MRQTAPWWLAWPAFATSLLTFIIPANYVRLTPVLETVSVGALVLSSVLGLVLLINVGVRRFLIVVGPVFLIWLVSSIASGDVLGTSLFLCPLFVGIALALSGVRWLTILVSLLAGTTVTLLLDYATSANTVSHLFGTPFQESLWGVGRRARGIVGQPVPAAVVGVALAAATFALAGTVEKERRRAVLRVLAVACSAVALVVTGTRSAIPLVLFAAALLWVGTRTLSARSGKVPLLSVLAICMTVILACFAGPALWAELQRTRLFDFEDLAGSASLVNRLYSGEILGVWANRCDLTCQLFGSGARDLQTNLQTTIGILGLSTIDNLFVTILWDFGYLGIASLAFAGLCALIVVGSRRADHAVKAGAIGVLLLLASGAAFDSLYSRSVLILFGTFLLMFLVRPPNEHAVNHGNSDASSQPLGLTPPPRHLHGLSTGTPTQAKEQ